MFHLTALPLSILSHIFSFLLPIPPIDPEDPVPPGLDQQTYHSLPEVLLPLMQASPALAEACKRLPQLRISYLTIPAANGNLNPWLSVLGHSVRGVSTRNRVLEWMEECEDGDSQKRACETLVKETVQLFRLMQTHANLVVLDMAHLPFHPGCENDLKVGLRGVLEANSATLRELAVPACERFDFCASVIGNVTLPNLKVFKIEQWGKLPTGKPVSTCLPKVVLRLMHAIDGHADRENRLSTLEDFRLVLMDGPVQPIDPREFNRSFLSNIRVLRLSFRRNPIGFFPEFFNVFSRVEHIYFSTLPRDMYIIQKEVNHTSNYFTVKQLSDLIGFRNECKRLKDLHICSAEWFDNPHVGQKIAPPLNPFKMIQTELLNFYEGSFVSFGVGVLMCGETMERLAKSSPRLRNVSIVLTFNNTYALHTLLKLCPINVLELFVSNLHDRPLDNRKWFLVSQALQSSKTISEFAILGAWNSRSGPDLDVDTVGLLKSCAIAVRSLQGKARRLVFRVVLQGLGFTEIVYAVSKILDDCRRYTPALEFLEVDFLKTKFKLKEDDPRLNGAAVKKLAVARQKLLGHVKTLQKVELGALDKIVKPRPTSINA